MSRTVFRNAQVFDGTELMPAGTLVVVEGNRISYAAGHAGEHKGGHTAGHTAGAPHGGRFKEKPGDRVYDLTGKTLMPGMFQCHFHTGFGPDAGNPSPYLGLNMPPAYLGMVAAKNAQLALNVGVTSIIGSSNGDLLDVCLKEAILLGLTKGPRVTPCTREMIASGDSADGDNRAWFMGIQNHGLIRRADGVDELRQAIREEVGRGCEIVKISISEGHGSQPIPDYNFYSAAEIRAAAETAHSRNALIRAHCPSRTGIIEAARAGFDIIDHADLIDDEGIEAVLEADAAITPSYLWSERFLGFAESWNYAMGNFPIGNGFPESRARTLERLAAVRRDFDYTASMMPKLRAAGVRMLLGDDYGFAMMPHGDYAAEMEVYVKHGVPPIEILRWATSNGADALRQRGRDLGRIEKGKLADLVVVAGDPTQDVSLFRDPDNIALVLKDGVVEKDLLSHTVVAA